MAYEVTEILISDILCDENFNCRGAKILPIDVAELIEDIKAYGLQMPITIQPYDSPGKKYRIVAGHRRFTAVRLIGEEKIPCFIRGDLDEMMARRLNLTENLKRQDLNILQEAKAISYFFEKGWTEEMVGEQLGTSRGWTQIRKMLLALPEDIQNEIAAGVLVQDAIRKLYTLREDQEAMYLLVKQYKEHKERGEKLSVPRKINALKKGVARTPFEIHALQEIVINNLGFSLATQLMGWAAGAVSDFEIHKAIQKDCVDHGILSYKIPKEIISAL